MRTTLLLLALLVAACGRPAELCEQPQGFTQPYAPSGAWEGEPCECAFADRTGGGCNARCYPLVDTCEVLLEAQSNASCATVAGWYRR